MLYLKNEFYKNFNEKNEPNNFNSAISFLRFDTDHLIGVEFGQLGTNAFFTLSDIRKLCGKMQMYFDEMLEKMLEQNKEQNRPNYDYIVNKHGEEKANEWLKNEGYGQINLILDIVNSQVDTVSLGILFRTHSFLENLLKQTCNLIKRKFDLEKSYTDITNKKLSTFEKCVKYLIEDTHLDNTLDKKYFNKLKAWNTVRNSLIHANGEVTNENKRLLKAIREIGLRTKVKRSGSITIKNGDLNTATQVLIETTFIQLDFAIIAEYIEILDKFLALLIHKNALNE